MAKVPNALLRLIDLVEGFDTDECITFKYRSNADGYSQVRLPTRKSVYAHRFSYCWSNDVDPEQISDLCVMHSCDNPVCVNPKHLSEGTWNDNNKDRATKGRTVVSTSRRKLTKEDVETIKFRYSLSKPRDPVNGVVALAKDFEVDTNLIYKAIKGGYDDWNETRTV
jgi:hypothetical protein